MLYCNLYRNWHWHYMWFTVIDPWNCLCEAAVLTHICLTLNSFCWTHETAHAKSLFCHRMALHGIYVGQPMKLPLYAKPISAIHLHYMGFTLVVPWNCLCKASVSPTIRITRAHSGRPLNCACKTMFPNICITSNSHWPAHNIAHVKSLSCDILVKLRYHIGQPMKWPVKSLFVNT